MALPPDPREAHLVFWFLLHRGRGRGSSFVFYFAWLSRNHWLLKMVWLWETLNLGRVSLPPFGACTVYQDFSLNRHNVKDTMEQYSMLQYSRRSGAPWTVLWQWVEFTQAGGKTVNVVYSLWTWTGSHQSWSLSCWDRKEYIQQASCRTLCTWDHGRLPKLRYNTWHGRCSRSYLAELLVVYSHLPGSVWFISGPDWWIKQAVIGAVILESFGSFRVALISTTPPESYCCWCPGWALLGLSYSGGSYSTGQGLRGRWHHLPILSILVVHLGTREMTTGWICRLSGPPITQTLTKICTTLASSPPLWWGYQDDMSSLWESVDSDVVSSTPWTVWFLPSPEYSSLSTMAIGPFGEGQGCRDHFCLWLCHRAWPLASWAPF